MSAWDGGGRGARQIVEEACQTFQTAVDAESRKAAEQVLLTFRASPLEVALSVLDETTLEIARYHALLAVRDGLAREWSSLGTPARAHLESSLCHILDPSSGVRERFVSGEACNVLARLAKRDAIAALPESAASMVPPIDEARPPGSATGRLIAHASALFGCADASAREGALELLSSLVHEFGAPAEGHLGDGGIPGALQQRARADFQAQHLPHLFDSLVALLFAMSPGDGDAAGGGGGDRCGGGGGGGGGAAADGAVRVDSPLLARTVGLLATVLGWDFAGTTGSVGGGAGAGGGRPGLLSATVRPPLEWRGKVDSLPLIAKAWSLYSALRATLAARAGGGEADGGAAAAAAAAAAAGTDGAGGGSARALEEGAHACRQLLVQLGSLHPSAFASERAQLEYIDAIVGPLLQMLRAPLPHAVGDDALAAEVRDVAQLCARLLANSGARALSRLPGVQLHALYAALARLACELAEGVSAAAADAADAEEAWQVDALDALLDVWLSLVVQHAPGARAHGAVNGGGGYGGGGGGGGGGGAGAEHELAPFAREVFGSATRATLAVARCDAVASGHEQVAVRSEDDAALAVRLGALAAVGRADVSTSVSLLCSSLAERTAQLRQLCATLADAAAPPVPSAAEHAAVQSLLEELDVLVRLSGHVLADAGEGEEPQVPEPLAALPAAAHPAAVLVDALCSLLSLQDHCVLGTGVDVSGLAISSPPGALPSSLAVSESVFATVLSPRLAESLLWFFERWARTYLLRPPPAHAPAEPAAAGGELLALWGANAPAGPSMLLRCVEAAVLRLLCWRGEPILAMHATRLLHALAQLGGAAPALAPLGAWQRILGAHAPGSAELSHLPPKAQRLLAEALVRAGSALESADAVGVYFDSLCGALDSRLAHLAGARDLEAVACHAAAQQEAVAICQCVRGICRASARLPWHDSVGPAARAHVHARLFSFVHACIQRLLPPLLPHYTHALDTALQLLKILPDCARTYAPAPHGSCAQLRQLAGTALHTASLYTQHFGADAQAAVAAAEGSASDGVSELALLEEEQRSKHVLSLLRTLTHLALALGDDMLEHNGAPDGGGALLSAAAADALSAFELLLPLLGVRMLGYPKLCLGYYELLASLLALARTPHAPPLGAALVETVRHSLAYGARNSSADVARVSLEALYACAAHAVHAPAAAAPFAPLVRAAQLDLLLDLAGCEVHPDAVEPAAGNALLALIAAQPDAWAAIAQHVQAHAHDAPTRDALGTLFERLLSSNNVHRSLDRPNRMRFRSNLQAFLMEARQRPLATAFAAARARRSA